MFYSFPHQTQREGEKMIWSSFDNQDFGLDFVTNDICVIKPFHRQIDGQTITVKCSDHPDVFQQPGVSGPQCRWHEEMQREQQARLLQIVGLWRHQGREFVKKRGVRVRVLLERGVGVCGVCFSFPLIAESWPLPEETGSPGRPLSEERVQTLTASLNCRKKCRTYETITPNIFSFSSQLMILFIFCHFCSMCWKMLNVHKQGTVNILI